MSEILELKAELRTCVGKGASRRLRRNAGLVPAIIYGEKTDPTLITLQHNKVTRALQDKNYYSSVVTVNVGKISEKVILKALQRHPYKKEILHMDFLRINADEKLQMNIPIHFMGEEIAPGVKTENGVITHYLNEIEVRCLPGDLPQFVELDISDLKLNETKHLSDIKLPENVESVALVNDSENDLPVVSIYQPKVAAEPEEATTESTEAESTESEQAEETKK